MKRRKGGATEASWFLRFTLCALLRSLVVQQKLQTGPLRRKRKSLAEPGEKRFSYRHCQLNRLLCVVRNVQDIQGRMRSARAAHQGDNLDDGWKKKPSVAWLHPSAANIKME